MKKKPGDYHLHTPLCRHATGSPDAYVREALEKGLGEICFTDHIPLPGGRDPGHRMAMDEVETYMDMIESVRKRTPDLSILTGIEADFIDGLESFLDDFLSSHPFDLVIMSVHFINQWPRGQWVFDFDYNRRNIGERYHEYFQALYRGVTSGLFDVVGHLDLIKQTGYPVLESNRDDVDNLLDAIGRQGMAVELNTSGLRKAISDCYPSREIMKRVVRKGIPVTLGSDAHSPDQVGYRFDDLGPWIENTGGVRFVRYENRRQIIDSR